MAFCYVVMCHTDPDGVLRLVRRIRDLSPHSRILVRYENPLFLDPAVVEAEGAQPLLSRTRVEWGRSRWWRPSWRPSRSPGP
ncbi:hypothetical protein GCM10025883_07860 [Mobilicoccus caccae]|uniref:Uncharacterized protein n=1 Tax=Mobilicoccus caccae TaxID=1859295 RepID=A0ABQ6ILW3_9MICO|nr:hypothetical protein GCM10025883_07860 [Mobilicoccus caccae]